jgi:chondroitin 4-sulfotransferase 11
MTKIEAYPLHDLPADIRPSPIDREGGQEGDLKGVHPVGWDLVCPCAFEATWNGGSRLEDIEIRPDVGAGVIPPSFVRSQLGEGRLTFYPGYQFKTEGELVLWVRGPINAPKDGLAALEQIVDATLLPCTVAVHWQFTRPRHTVRFEAGEPFATLLPYPKAGPETARLEVVEGETDEAACEQAFQQMVDSPALRDVFTRLGAAPYTASADEHKLVPQTSAAQLSDPPPVRFLDTVDGRVDLQQFEPDFFIPERFFGQWREEYLSRFGEVYLREFYFIDALELVYLSIPKAACTAIKLALAKAIGIDYKPDQNLAYMAHFHPHWQGNQERGELSAARRGYYRFSFVRNPFDRLVSCYRQKILLAPPSWMPAPFFQGYLFVLPANSSFADFCQRVSRIPDALADSHFKSQYALLYRGDELQVDAVGKVEQLERDWKPIAERYGLDPVLVQANVTKDKPGCHSDYRLYYTEPLIQLVYERYRKDVELFGYRKDYENLLEFVRIRERDAVSGLSERELCYEQEVSES